MIKEIIIKTQEEFDRLPIEFKQETQIKIQGNLSRINKSFKNGYIAVSGSATIGYVSGSATIEHVSGSATIEYVSGSATIEAVYDSATIKYVYGSATIQYVYDSATIGSVYDSATIGSVHGSATIESVSGSATIGSVYGSATIGSVYDSATIKYVYGSATIKSVYDSATIGSVYDSATIGSVHGSATIKYVSDSATIGSVYDSATIKSVSGNSIIRILSSQVKLLKVNQEAVIICQGCKCEIKDKGKSVSVLYKKQAKHNIESFCRIFGLKPTKAKYITLYKSVQSKSHLDFYTKSIKYEGIVECPDWNPDPNIKCGYGLHLSATKKDALSYNPEGDIIKCKVNIKDIVIYPYDISKIRCRRVQVLKKIRHGNKEREYTP